MATELGKKGADALWAQLRALLDKIGWNYTEVQAPEGMDDYILSLKMKGDDLPMNFYVGIDAGRQVLYLKSPEFVQFSAEQIPTAAVAICAINDSIFDGSYSMNVVTGAVMFTYTVPFAGSILHDDVILQMLQVSAKTVDEYNDKLFALQKGMLDLNTFLKIIR